MALSEIRITPTEYQKIAKLVYSRFGIDLGEKKQTLVCNRLRKVLVDKNFNSFEQYYQFVQNDQTGHAMDTLINKISTNLTYFAREHDHFAYLRDEVIKELIARDDVKRKKSLRIWCAGCSTGEEAYTLAMSLHMSLQNTDIKPAVLATDISARALDVAQKGVYNQEDAAKLGSKFAERYFVPAGNKQLGIKPDIRKMVLFRRLNLMRPDFPFKNKFQVIFCRNVMIYFDTDTRQTLARKFSDNLMDKGYLFIGHSESLGRTNPYFEYLKPAVYKKVAHE